VASILDTVRDLGRLRQIVRVLVRHGFGEIVQRTGLASLRAKAEEAEASTPESSRATRIREVLTDLGPSFIKLGQILSTRPDLVPADVHAELARLQDQVPPMDAGTVEQVIEAELGDAVDALFADFDRDPIASASIGQVHRARLPDGGPEVAVKVQRPNLRETIERDVDLLYWLARVVERSIPEAVTYQPVQLVREFDRAITAELDFELEAEHADRFRKNFEDEPCIRFPRIHHGLSTRRVLTLEFFDGYKIFEAIDRGFDARSICRTTLGLVLQAVFEDGFFHADPHPGNFILMGPATEPVIGVVDLGLVGHLTPQLRDKTIDLMIAAVQEDHRGMADALYAIGSPVEKIDRDAFEGHVARLADRYLGRALKDIEVSRLIQDLVHSANRFGLEIPSDFLLVGKAMMTIEGIGRQIDPDLDVFEEMKPYFLRLMWARYAPEKIAPDVLRTLTRVSSAAGELPVQSQEVLDDLRRGRLEVRTRLPTLPMTGELLGRRIYSGLVVGALLTGSAHLFAYDHPLFGLFFFGGAVGWAMLHHAGAFWHRRREKHRR
jgi:ubiquinone biosynthesis protein